MAEVLKEVRTTWMTKRDVLWILVFIGFAVNYMIRINLNIAIVAMVKQKKVSMENIATSSECLRESRMKSLNEENAKQALLDNITAEAQLTTEISRFLLNETDENYTAPATLRIHESMTTPKNLLKSKPVEIESGFIWNEYEQGLILGAFFWLHWCTQVPGGLLAQKYGTKLIYGLSNFTGVLCCFLIPVASYWGWKALIFVRCFQGILAGFAWPAMHNMTAKWIPPNERGKFVTAYLGSSVGAALTFPMCGFIIDLCGWEYVFYISGILGSLWFCCWWILVFDSPAQHPSITQHERDYIEACLGQSVANQKEKAPVPWRHILTSVPVWMNILAQWGGIWGLFTLMTHAPSYFKYIHGWNIRVTGLLSGMPHMLRMVFAYLFSLVGDYLLRSNKMSRTNVRKLATGLCTIGQGVCMLALAYSGCNSEAAIVFLTLATAIHGTVSSGPLASFVDISPNYASVCLGLCGMIAVLPGFISPAVVGTLTYQNNTVGQWQMVFLIAVAMLMVSGVAYILFSRSDLEPWNNPETMCCSLEKVALESELKPLKSEKEEQATIITEKEKTIK